MYYLYTSSVFWNKGKKILDTYDMFEVKIYEMQILYVFLKAM